MIAEKIAHRDFGTEDRPAVLVDGGRGPSVLIALQEEAREALARAREDAAMEALDVLSQADEALVLG